VSIQEPTYQGSNVNAGATERCDVAIVGGGVIGVCCAYYLAKAGLSVSLFERDQICSACSSGNAGLIVPSHSVPLTNLHNLGQALKSLFSHGPFQIEQPMDLQLLKWLVRFALACKHKQVNRATRILRDLIYSSAKLYEELALLMDFGWCRKGSLALFATRRGFKAGQHESEILGDFGIKSQLFKGAELPEVDRVLSSGLYGGFYYPQDASLRPADFVRRLAALVEESGAQLHTGVQVLGFKFDRSGIAAAKTTSGEYVTRNVVIAAGAWSPALARELDLRLPIQPAKGYGFTIESPSCAPRTPLLLSEARIAVTPMEGTIRFTGGLDLCSTNTSLNTNRMSSLFADTRRYLMHLPQEKTQLWCGLRPCTPDGLPIISRSTRQKNVIIATGHGMLGMTLGPITGKLVCDLLRKDSSEVEIPELSFDRFG
jgi:D-amino-acid dehydrogenase